MYDEEQELRIAIPVPASDVQEQYIHYFTALEHLGVRGEIVTADCDPKEFDGLLLPGGVDIDPREYHEENKGSVRINDALDELQMPVLKKFVEAQKPVFGICRGHQLINVFFGGTLLQHIDAYLRHARDPGADCDKVHASKAVEGSYIEELYGKECFTNSSHHQAADALGKGLIVQQYSDDGYVEAAKHESLPIWSVQWHPERMCFEFARNDTVDGSAVLSFFLERCREHR